MKRSRRRWKVIVCKLPIVLPFLVVVALLELVTALTWYLYCLADKSRDAVHECWMSVESRLPSSFERLK